MSSVQGKGHSDLIRDLARTTGVPEDQVAKLLQHMGLDLGLQSLQGKGGRQNDGRLASGDVKLAIRAGRTFVTV